MLGMTKGRVALPFASHAGPSEQTVAPLRFALSKMFPSVATVMVMVTDGLKAVPFNRFSSPWVGRRPMISPVEMTNLFLPRSLVVKAE